MNLWLDWNIWTLFKPIYIDAIAGSEIWIGAMCETACLLILVEAGNDLI
jgi:hypothetical protein